MRNAEGQIQDPQSAFDRVAIARADELRDAEQGWALMGQMQEKWRIEGGIIYLMGYPIDHPMLWNEYHVEGWRREAALERVEAAVLKTVRTVLGGHHE